MEDEEFLTEKHDDMIWVQVVKCQGRCLAVSGKIRSSLRKSLKRRSRGMSVFRLQTCIPSITRVPFVPSCWIRQYGSCVAIVRCIHPMLGTCRRLVL